MDDFGVIDRSMQRFEQRKDVAALYSMASPWPKKEATKSKTEKRIAEVKSDFQEFDRLYFPPEMYAEDYSPPNEFHRFIARCCAREGKAVDVILGPNGVAKSATIYKWDIWAAIFGHRHFICYAGETLDSPRAIIRAIQSYLLENARIQHDFPDLEFVYASTEYLHVRSKHNAKGTVFIPLSTDRSARGKLANLTERPDLIHIEDLENRTSSMTPEAVKNRRDRVEEMRNSLSPRGNLTITANNFDERSLANQYKTEYEAGELDAKLQVHTFPAWGKYRQKNGRYSLLRGTRHGPLWPERFPAKSEAELRLMMGTSSDEDWLGGQQQQPIKPQGDFFRRSHWLTYDKMPGDLVGITYVDPNLAKKSKGDRTCSAGLIYSYETQLAYVYRPRYRSYADSNDLLDDLVDLWRHMISDGVRLIGAAMDGNVSQESHWSNHVANFAELRQMLMPPIDYTHFTVDQIAKLAQSYWAQDKILMPEQFPVREEQQHFQQDLHAFTGRKRPGVKDDAPDWLVCAVQYMTECGIEVGGMPAPPARARTRKRMGSRPTIGKI